MARDSPASGRADPVIRGLAGSQYGAVARGQLLGAGVSAREIQRRVDSGRLERLHRGVYAVGPVAGTRRAEMAALLACGAETVLSHRTAAGCLAMIPDTPGAVAVSTLRDVRIREPGILVHRVASLPPDEVTDVDGLPVTAPGRTLLDLAACVDDWELERALARALREGLVDRSRLRTILGRYPRRRGRRRLRALLDSGDAPAFVRSEAERRMLALIRSAGLPTPRVNVIVEGLEVDFLWPQAGLIVEVDGRAYHGHDHAFEIDRDRDGALIAAGYRIMRVTWAMIVHRPDELKDRLTNALAHR